MCVVDGEQVGIAPTRTSLTGIGEVLETVETQAVTVLIRKLPAYQITLCETMVNLDVELVVVIVSCAGSEPVVVDVSARGGLRKQVHHLLRHRIDQIALNARIRTARAGVR